VDTGRKTVGCPQENSSTVNSTGTGVYHGIVAVRHLEGDVGHLEDVRPPVGVRFQHVADQLRQRLRVALLLVGRYVELAALHTHTHTRSKDQNEITSTRVHGQKKPTWIASVDSPKGSVKKHSL